MSLLMSWRVTSVTVILLSEVVNPASFMRAFAVLFVEIQNIPVNKLELKAEVPKVFERWAALHFLSFNGPHNSH